MVLVSMQLDIPPDVKQVLIVDVPTNGNGSVAYPGDGVEHAAAGGAWDAMKNFVL